jgi:pimeloyl-ACP methyl ester carboxylesterase
VPIVRDNIGPLNIYLRDKRLTRVKAPDVVMLQGFGTGPRCMRPVADHLKANGLHCAAAPTGGLLGHLQTASIRRAAKRLTRYLAKLPPGHKPWILGHSIGGIIARWAIQRGGAHPHVAGLITLGSPHQGCPAAVAGVVIAASMLSTAPWSILPGAPLIRQLGKSPWPMGLPFISITSNADLLCRPKWGQVDFADDVLVRNMVVDGLGHTKMLRDPKLLNVIVQLMAERDAA